MARNRFEPSWHGYRNVMNSHNEVMTACQMKGESIAASAATQTGVDYSVDSRLGMNRVHTRVSTVGAKEYYRERHYHALSIALGSMGGIPRPKGYGGSATKRKFTAARGGSRRRGRR